MAKLDTNMAKIHHHCGLCHALQQQWIHDPSRRLAWYDGGKVESRPQPPNGKHQLVQLFVRQLLGRREFFGPEAKMVKHGDEGLFFHEPLRFGKRCFGVAWAETFQV